MTLLQSDSASQRPLFVAFLFHAMTSLLPPSFHRNDFSTCSTLFILGQSPIKNMMFCADSPRAHSTHAHAHTATPPRRIPRVRVVDTCTQMAICSHGGPRSTVDMYSCSKTIARCPCTPPSTLRRVVNKSAPRLVPVRR